MTHIDDLAIKIKSEVDKLAKVLKSEIPEKPYYQTIDMSDWDERWKQTELFVDASDGDEDHNYFQYAKEDWMKSYSFGKSSNCLDWKKDSGCGETIGWLKRLDGEHLPVLITCMWSRINGHLVGFYRCNSMVCDYGLIRDFIHFHFPKIPHTNGNNLWDGLRELGIKCVTE